MREILENSIDFSKLEGYSKDDIKFEMKRAVLSRETGVLELEAELNFVLPYETIDRFKRTLQGRLPEIKDISIRLSYDGLIQSRDEAIGAYIEHMIALVNGRYAHVTKTIYRDKWRLEENQLVIYALGELSVEILNRDVAGKFQMLLKRDLKEDISVRFENDSQEYRNLGRTFSFRGASGTCGCDAERQTGSRCRSGSISISREFQVVSVAVRWRQWRQRVQRQTKEIVHTC